MRVPTRFDGSPSRRWAACRDGWVAGTPGDTSRVSKARLAFADARLVNPDSQEEYEEWLADMRAVKGLRPDIHELLKVVNGEVEGQSEEQQSAASEKLRGILRSAVSVVSPASGL